MEGKNYFYILIRDYDQMLSNASSQEILQRVIIHLKILIEQVQCSYKY